MKTKNLFRYLGNTMHRVVKSFNPTNKSRTDMRGDDGSSVNYYQGGRGLPLMGGRQEGSFLINDTTKFNRLYRINVQQGHERFAKVLSRDHQDELTSEPENDIKNLSDIEEHILLSSQRTDGAIPRSPKERTEFNNRQNEQKLQKELRLGLSPRMSTAPRPNFP